MANVLAYALLGYGAWRAGGLMSTKATTVADLLADFVVATAAIGGSVAIFWMMPP